MDDTRLGCIYCDISDFDGITEEMLSHCENMGWEGIEPVEPSANALDWETHIGTCPQCVNAERLRMLNHPSEEVRKFWRAKKADQQEPTNDR